jgi:hypothetical protein
MRNQHDPLAARVVAKAIAAATLVTFVLAVYLSATTPVPDEPPGIALGSSALLHLERALLAGAAIGVVLMFLVRGWAGYYPSKVSTTGAEYPSLLALEQATEGSGEIVEALAALQAQHDEFAEHTARDLASLRRELKESASSSLTPSGT